MCKQNHMCQSHHIASKDKFMSMSKEQHVAHGQRPKGFSLLSKVIAFIEEPKVVRKILAHLNISTETPKITPARSPPQDDFFDDYDFAEGNFAS